jgi:hypothetical protein
LKKAISILLLFIFLFSSAGFSINAHYCKGKLQSVNLLFIHKECTCGKKKMPKDCCKNKTEIVKIKDNYIPTQIITPSSTEQIVFEFIQSFDLSIAENFSVKANLNYLYPPDNPLSLSILYRSILI